MEIHTGLHNLAYYKSRISHNIHMIYFSLYGKYSKIFNTFLVLFPKIKCWLSSLKFTKANSITLIRLLLWYQSDLGLHCLFRPFWKATSVGNLRTLTIFSYLSQCMRFPTIWYVQPAKTQTSLRIRSD